MKLKDLKHKEGWKKVGKKVEKIAKNLSNEIEKGGKKLNNAAKRYEVKDIRERAHKINDEEVPALLEKAKNRMTANINTWKELLKDDTIRIKKEELNLQLDALEQNYNEITTTQSITVINNNLGKILASTQESGSHKDVKENCNQWLQIMENNLKALQGLIGVFISKVEASELTFKHVKEKSEKAKEAKKNAESLLIESDDEIHEEANQNNDTETTNNNESTKPVKLAV